MCLAKAQGGREGNLARGEPHRGDGCVEGRPYEAGARAKPSPADASYCDWRELPSMAVA